MGSLNSTCATNFNCNSWIFSGWELGERLGSGAFARVYRAWKSGTLEQAAVKVLNKYEAHNTAASLRAEIEILKLLSQRMTSVSTIAEIFGIYQDSTAVYIVMKMYSGGTLEDRITAFGHISESETHTLVRQLLLGVLELQQAGVVHCDLKPDNILLQCEHNMQNPKICDFGLAMSEQLGLDTEHVVGTECYIAPEVLTRQAYSSACDVWALGVVTYKALCGRLPFPTNEKAKQARAEGIPSSPPKLILRSLQNNDPKP
mmetsp:Transcript_1259/g.3010  ORF Transcript_1259/g.3010 Transcript_1259/m.3010 type:complete len:259 (+) Transcript_1259:241-1017(+)